MPVRLDIERILIHHAPESWGSEVETFRRLLESAIEQELRSVAFSGSIQEHAILRVDLPPMAVGDTSPMEVTVAEIARRVALAVRQPPGK
jgi:hypothetical protein